MAIATVPSYSGYISFWLPKLPSPYYSNGLGKTLATWAAVKKYSLSPADSNTMTVENATSFLPLSAPKYDLCGIYYSTKQCHWPDWLINRYDIIWQSLITKVRTATLLADMLTYELVNIWDWTVPASVMNECLWHQVSNVSLSLCVFKLHQEPNNIHTCTPTEGNFDAPGSYNYSTKTG